MKVFKNKAAVITGAASGIRLGIAKRCVKEGIKTVLSYIEEKLPCKVNDEFFKKKKSTNKISSINIYLESFSEITFVFLFFSIYPIIPSTLCLKINGSRD